ncbi:flavin reductase family protein [Clostridium aminobutyricum]|uniref:Flavin reductase family protein n=1 Tax=Clostridium aminobutyricum TaxID=33953 RepID=A0A939IFR2_CLOAM|nr:flavin reductase family protein [Clostridium aminobutyricum]MBN7771760.1 flavin reductase family protein [Clostridium aminobutyricum]
MSTFQPMRADSFDFSPFRMIGKEWMLITAEKDGKVNSMTASWGGLGVIWGKNVAYIVVRKSRYTKELIDSSDTFSLSFLEHKKYGEALNYMGTVSGRDEDKIKGAGVTVDHREGVPYIAEASTVMLCKKMCCQPITPDNFIANDIDKQWYPDKDYHDLYIGEIVEILTR